MSEFDFPVFSSSGQMLGNLTSAQGQQPIASPSDIGSLPALPALSSTFAPSQTSPGNVVTSSGSASNPLSLVTTSGATVGTPSNATASAVSAPSSGIQSGSIADYFLRAVIVILGFIFVAIGLNMFKPGIVILPGKK